MNLFLDLLGAPVSAVLSAMSALVGVRMRELRCVHSCLECRAAGR